MGNVVAFKQKSKSHNEQLQQQVEQENKELARQRRLANWLREVADLVERDHLDVEPLAAVLVLSGSAADAVLNLGYEGEDVDFEAACRAPLRRLAVRSTDMHVFRR